MRRIAIIEWVERAAYRGREPAAPPDRKPAAARLTDDSAAAEDRRAPSEIDFAMIYPLLH